MLNFISEIRTTLENSYNWYQFFFGWIILFLAQQTLKWIIKMKILLKLRKLIKKWLVRIITRKIILLSKMWLVDWDLVIVKRKISSHYILIEKRELKNWYNYSYILQNNVGRSIFFPWERFNTVEELLLRTRFWFWKYQIVERKEEWNTILIWIYSKELWVDMANSKKLQEKIDVYWRLNI
jgi:hypothetical protein